MRWLVSALAVLAFCPAGAQLAKSAWPKFHANLTNTGLGIGSGATSVVKWTFATEDVLSDPAVGPNNILYVASVHGNNVYAIDGSSGTLIWTVTLSTPSLSCPVLDSNGRLYVSSASGYLYALASDTGSSLWTFMEPDTGNPEMANPSIGPNGIVYVGSQTDRVYAVGSSTGNLLWSFYPDAFRGTFEGCPTIGSDGTVYIGGGNGGGSDSGGVLYALNGANGSQLWSFNTNSQVEYFVTSAALASTGMLYFGSTDGNVYAVDSGTGALKWTYTTSGLIYSSPAIGVDGTVYVGSNDANVYALNGVTGKLKWSFTTGAAVEASPAIGADGTVYVASQDGNVYALNGQTGALVWSSGAAGSVLGDPVIGGDGTLYVAPNNGGLVAFGAGLLPQLLSLSPAAVVGGQSTSGTVLLTAPAPSGGAIVTLASTSAAGIVPNSVTVPGGSTSATFPVSTPVVVAQFTATISATLNGVSQTALLTVNPYKVASVSVSPTIITGGNTGVGTVTLNGPAPTGGMTVTLSSTNGVASVPTLLTVPAGQASQTFSVQTTAVTGLSYATISASLNGASSASQKITIGPPVLTTLNLSPSTVAGGTASVGTVTLSGGAPAGGAKVLLSSSNASATLPSSVTVPAGKTSATFTIHASLVSVKTIVDVSSNYGQAFETEPLTIMPPTLASVSLSPASLAGGASSTGTVTLTGPAPTGGFTVKLTSSQKAATVPASVKISAGKSSATFTIKTIAVGASTSSVIEGTLAGVSQSATLTISAPALLSVKVSPASVVGGKTSTGTVTLGSAAPSGGIAVSLLSSLSGVTVPASVTIPAGKTSATFTVKTVKVGSKTAATISATLGTTSKTATLTVT